MTTGYNYRSAAFFQPPGFYFSVTLSFPMSPELRKGEIKCSPRQKRQTNAFIVLGFCLHTEPSCFQAVLPTNAGPRGPLHTWNLPAGTFEQSRLLALERCSSRCLLRVLLHLSKVCTRRPSLGPSFTFSFLQKTFPGISESKLHLCALTHLQT